MILEQTELERAERLEQVGSVALMITLAVRTQQFDRLKNLIRAAAVKFSDAEARWIFRRVQSDIPPELKRWFEEAISAIREGGHD